MTTKWGTYCRWSEHNPHRRSAVLCLHLLLPKPWNQNTINLLQAGEKWEAVSPLLASTWTLNVTLLLEVSAEMALQGYAWTRTERLQVVCAHCVCKWYFFSNCPVVHPVWGLHKKVYSLNISCHFRGDSAEQSPKLHVLRNSLILWNTASLSNWCLGRSRNQQYIQS